MNEPKEHPDHSRPKQLQLKKLTVEQVRHLDDLLDSLEEYGEVHLVVQQGELRYINKVESFKAWKDDKKG